MSSLKYEEIIVLARLVRTELRNIREARISAIECDESISPYRQMVFNDLIEIDWILHAIRKNKPKQIGIMYKLGD